MMKTFRGKIAPSEQEMIRLSTNDGLTGYKINKFQIITAAPGTATATEFVVKVFSRKQDSVTGTIDFTDPVLLAVAYQTDDTTPSNPTSNIVIFDTMKFNQDIFVTAVDNSAGSTDVNYYLELEQVRLDLNEATVATLKDMRGRE
jgi:hypothetical protein